MSSTERPKSTERPSDAHINPGERKPGAPAGREAAHGDQSAEEVQRFWEELYTERGQRWSGRPNQRLVEVAVDLPPGNALDLGCGEGGDAIWLAGHGWRVSAVDVSPTALERLRTRAEADGVTDRVEAIHVDLARAFPDPPAGGWDLVSAQFFQSPIELPRSSILRRGAAAVATDGVLLVVDHGAGPPGSDHHHVAFPSVDETMAELALDSAAWTHLRIEQCTRDAEGPDGQIHEYVDNVIALRRA